MNGLCQSLGWAAKAVKGMLEVAGVGGLAGEQTPRK